MAPWTLDVKFLFGTQFTFRSLTFATSEDGNLMMLPPGLAPERLTSAYGQAPYFPAISSTSDGVYSGLDLYAGPYIRTAKLIRGIPVMTSILQSSVGASSSSTLAVSPDQDLADDYPEIEGSTYGDSTEEGHLIVMVAPVGGPSHNSSSRYPTIKRSEASMIRCPMME
jgi:hypothetical protein